uniref:ATP synthase complex subunit 8 n=1 Tax=Eboraphyllus middletoni TaxID=2546603 RepID=A0A6H0N2D4_9CUCU|nr:ATP synthase F0 subunit 8 [Eboraphyllus middletoni]
MFQMAPMNWLMLMLFFTATFIFFNKINYYSFIYNIKKLKNKKYKLIINWKW